MNNEPKHVSRTRTKHASPRVVIAIVVVLLLGAMAYFYGPAAVDAARASQYQPSAQVASITKEISLTSRGGHIFYATSPQVESRAQFNTHCQSTERTAAILGCYVDDRIYLYNISNDELKGATEVTAAHEMLHAAYARLNVFQRAQVNNMVEAEYLKIKDEPDIADAMAYYTQAEPGEELNELHSIIGTTVKDLPAGLERYYARYFTDRSAIVDMNTAYTAVFDKLNSQATELQEKITTQAAEIKSARESYDADLTQLNSDIESFNARAGSGGFSSQYSFNQARGALVARIDSLTSRQVTLNSKIDAYNANIVEYNKLAVRAKQLNQSINGVEAPNSI